MRVDVFNRAGHGGSQIAPQVMHAAYEVAPLVEKYSGLTLPEVVTVRLVTPRGLRKANTALFRQSFDVMRERHPSIPRPVAWMFRTLVVNAVRVMMPVAWRGLGGQHVPDYRGAPSTVLIIPRSLKLSRSNARNLRLILAHELTHAAQHEADPWLSIDAVAQVINVENMRDHKDELGQSSTAVEGHAVWVHHQVVNELYGTEMRERAEGYDGPGSWSYRLSRKVANHIPVVAHKIDDYQTGCAFVDAVHDIGGLDMVNHLWDGIDAMPTTDEIADPKAWTVRVGG